MKTDYISKTLSLILLAQGVYILYTLTSVVLNYYTPESIFLIPVAADLITGLGLILAGIGLFFHKKWLVISYGIAILAQIVLMFILPQMTVAYLTRSMDLFLVIVNIIILIGISLVILRKSN